MLESRCYSQLLFGTLPPSEKLSQLIEAAVYVDVLSLLLTALASYPAALLAVLLYSGLPLLWKRSGARLLSGMALRARRAARVARNLKAQGVDQAPVVAAAVEEAGEATAQRIDAAASHIEEKKEEIDNRVQATGKDAAAAISDEAGALLKDDTADTDLPMDQKYLFLLTHLVLGTLSVVEYAKHMPPLVSVFPDLATYMVAIVLYKPLSLSLFQLIIALDDYSHWHAQHSLRANLKDRFGDAAGIMIDARPEGVWNIAASIKPESDTKEEPPLEQNFLLAVVMLVPLPALTSWYYLALVCFTVFQLVLAPVTMVFNVLPFLFVTIPVRVLDWLIEHAGAELRSGMQPWDGMLKTFKWKADLTYKLCSVVIFVCCVARVWTPVVLGCGLRAEDWWRAQQDVLLGVGARLLPSRLVLSFSVTLVFPSFEIPELRFPAMVFVVSFGAFTLERFLNLWSLLYNKMLRKIGQRMMSMEAIVAERTWYNPTLNALTFYSKQLSLDILYVFWVAIIELLALICRFWYVRCHSPWQRRVLRALLRAISFKVDCEKLFSLVKVVFTDSTAEWFAYLFTRYTQFKSAHLADLSEERLHWILDAAQLPAGLALTPREREKLEERWKSDRAAAKFTSSRNLWNWGAGISGILSTSEKRRDTRSEVKV